MNLNSIRNFLKKIEMQVLAVKYVAQSLNNLRRLGIHRNTIMYLCIKWNATRQKTTENLKIDFREFFDRFLTVRDSPNDRLHKPYILPFESSDAKIWLNRNLAGSFAPSSIRPENPVNTVMAMNGSGSKVTYTLKQNHSLYAFNNLLNSVKIPALDLAIFLYRDFGFNTNEMNADKLLTIFKSEFGYLGDEDLTFNFTDFFSYDSESVPEDLFATFFKS